jgi:4-amino-4-deoxy-L-arabinose transferase-like glycosyltransferase
MAGIVIPAVALSAYMVLAFMFAARKAPWVDEGWIASAPANWANTGSFGTPSLQPTGSWLNAELTGIREFTYWNLPVSITVQGLWYKLVGFSLLKMRALSIFSGVMALLSWFAIVSKLAGSKAAACITILLLSFDFTFLWGAADGRMDMMCGGLGAAGLATYLVWREKHFAGAICVANSFLALSVFTHPNGILFFIAFVVLLWQYDRHRMTWRSLPAIAPYLALAALWALYALRHPDYFLAQISANSMAIGGARWGGLAHPLIALRNEIVIRYLSHYGVYPIWGGNVPHYALLIPVSYWFVLFTALCFWGAHRTRELAMFLGLTALIFGFMAIFIGLKAQCYLILILPFFAATAAVFFCRSHSARSALAPLSAFLVAVVLGSNIAVIASKLRTNPFASEYLKTVQFVRGRLHPGERVTADSYFGFDLGFDRVNDDCRVGYYSGFRTNLVIEDRWYGIWWRTLFEGEEPSIASYVRQLLKTEYRPIFRNGPYRVYEHRGG